MKVFDFSTGHRGKILASIPRANSTGGWLQRKRGEDQVWKVFFARSKRRDSDWFWCTGATYLERADTGEIIGERDIRPETYGVQAIAFCIGKLRAGEDKGRWHWYVIGTPEWNRWAVSVGMLRCERSHIMTPADRGRSAAWQLLCEYPRTDAYPAEQLAEYAERYDCTIDDIRRGIIDNIEQERREREG